MNRKKIEKEISLNTYEQSIEDALDFKKLKRPSIKTQEKVRAAANATLKDIKSARANIRMNEDDLEILRVLAEQAGMPYQTLINHIIHLYVTGQLINVQEVKKMVNAGIFKQHKTGHG
jgi:predicted DNA binding CopG/RHH family protein